MKTNVKDTLANIGKKGNIFVVEEDTNEYNIFEVDMFDEESGYLIGYEYVDGYHIDDFVDMIVYQTSSFEDACAWTDRQMGYTE